MMVIPAIDIMAGEVVRLYKGDPSKKTIYGRDPVAMARKWEEQGAHMLHVVDLDATLSLGKNQDTIRDIAKAVSIPVQAAGGLRDSKAVYEMLNMAERAVIGTLAMDSGALEKLAGRFGDRLVVAVDHRGGHVMTHGWQKDSGMDVEHAVSCFARLGATQFLVTDVSRDGTLQGPDLAGLEAVCNMDGINVIASGGISNIHDVHAVYGLRPYGVILGKALYEGLVTIPGALQC